MSASGAADASGAAGASGAPARRALPRPHALRMPPARVLLALTLIAWGIGEALTLDGAWPVAARIAFVVAAVAPVAWIDRWPWAVVAILLAAIAVHVSQDVITMSVTPLQGVAIAGWVAGAEVAARWRSVAALVLVIAAALLAMGGIAPFGTAVACSLGWAGARAVLGVRRRRATAAAVLREARAEAGALRSGAIDAERMRLARELDAVVLHAVRVIGQDARRAQAQLAGDPEAARASLRRIAGATREAIGQMRRALAVLRTDDGDDDAPPRPDALEAAVAQLRATGVAVSVHDDRRAAPDRGLPAPAAARDAATDHDPATTLAAARVLEVIAGSGWRPRRLEVRRDRDGARIVADARGAEGAPERTVLARIAERARLHGGTATLRRRPRPRDPGAQVVDVRLPALDGLPRHRIGTAGLIAGAIAGVATVLDVATGASIPVAPGDEPTVLGTAVTALVTAGAVTAAWTRRPVGLVALAAVSFLRGIPVGFVGLDSTTLPLLALTAFLTPLWLRDGRWRAAVAAPLAAGGIAVMVTSWSDPLAFSDVAIMTCSCAIPWLIAVAARDAAEEADRLTVLRWATAGADLVAAQAAVDDERRRVARDLHDLVGHGLALVSVQAWGAERALPASPAKAADGLAAIRRVLAASVAELERLVAPWEEEPAVAAPSVAALVREAHRAGLPVTLDAFADGVPVDPAAVLDQAAAAAPAAAPGRAAPRTRAAASSLVPEAVGLAVGRIVQEALTNVLRHAPGAPTRVTVRRERGTVVVAVRNDPPSLPAAAPPTPSSGVGLAGMRERVEALGGTLAAAPDAGGGFAVSATFPL